MRDNAVVKGSYVGCVHRTKTNPQSPGTATHPQSLSHPRRVHSECSVQRFGDTAPGALAECTHASYPSGQVLGFLQADSVQDCYDCEGDGWVGGESNWFWLLTGLVLVPGPLSYGEDLLSIQNQDSARASSLPNSSPSPAARSDKTHPLTSSGCSLGMVTLKPAKCSDGLHMSHLLM